MTAKFKFNREFFAEWQKDPKATAEKFGFNWAEFEAEFQNQDFKRVSFDEFEKMFRKSKFAGFFNFDKF